MTTLSVSSDPGLLLHAARFITKYVQLVGQEPAPSKCVLWSTSRVVRMAMKEWVLSQEGDKWSVKFDVWDLGRSFGYYLSWMVFDLSCKGLSGHFSSGSGFCSPPGFSW